MTSKHWRLAAFIFVVFVAAAGAWYARDANQRDIYNTWQNQLAYCNDANNAREDIKNFIGDILVPPREEQYSYIADPQLRAGVLAQAQERYNRTIEKRNKAFAPRDCDKIFPKPEGL